jgi:hypothetical protein
MDPLAKIEAAIEALPADKKEELLVFLAARLRDQSSARSERPELARSQRGFPISKARAPFTSADVALIDSESQ